MSTERTHKSPPRSEIPFVKDEKEYCARNKVEIRKLPTGMIIIGGLRNVDGEFKAELRTSFQTGALNDPSGKEGLHHLVEHLSVPDYVNLLAHSKDTYINANTSYNEFNFDLNGTSNPEVPEYGIWPVIQDYARMLEDPRNYISDLDLAIRREKEVVLRELAERGEGEDEKIRRFRNITLFASDNPINHESGGTPEGMSQITRRDVESTIEQALIPKGTVVGIFEEGSTQSHRKLIETVEKAFLTFPRTEIAPNKPDVSGITKISPDFKTGETFEHQGNKPVRNVLLVWLFNEGEYTTRSLALDRLTPEISRRVNDWVRSNGLSYGASADSSNFDGNLVWSINFQLGSSADLKSMINGRIVDAIRSLIASISDDQIKEMNVLEELRQKAIPMPAKNRWSLAFHGLVKYGEMIDADIVKDHYKEITTEHTKDWRGSISDIKPAILVY